MRALVIWLASSAIGTLMVVLLPEDMVFAGRLFSLSPSHGPSLSDATGIAIMLAGWAWFVRATWIAWLRRERAGLGAALAGLAGAGVAACLLAVSADRDVLAFAFGAVAAAAQIALAIIPHCFAAKESE